MPEQLPETAETDIKGINRVFSEYMDKWDEVDDELVDWLDRHPNFCRELGFFKEGKNPPTVANYQFDDADSDNVPNIESEFEFLVAWGYRQGIAHVTSAIDGNVRVPHDGYEPDE
jgi:hypothetical protein